jgi:tRNA (cytidine/uridine-2'-O-)-methyltransferase
LYADAKFAPDDVLLFGRETSGLPDAIHAKFTAAQRLRLPMVPGSRSMNLANTVSVVLFEAWRQNGFLGGG